MARNPEATSRIEILLLSTLCRIPMHGYELKTELRYRHVKWWAKLEHGHLYAALSRLEKRGDIRQARSTAAPTSRGRRVYRVTPQGRRRVERELENLGRSPDGTYFDIDLFLVGAFVLPQRRVVEILTERARQLQVQLEAANALRQAMGELVPAAGRLIMEHRVSHLELEIAFAERAAKEMKAVRHWGPFLGRERIGDFVARTRVPLE